MKTEVDVILMFVRFSPCRTQGLEQRRYFGQRWLKKVEFYRIRRRGKSSISYGQAIKRPVIYHGADRKPNPVAGKLLLLSPHYLDEGLITE